MGQEQQFWRQVIYLSGYDNQEKGKSVGYVSVVIRNELCEVQIYYRGWTRDKDRNRIQPIFLFSDGSAVEGEEFFVREGMLAEEFETATENFLNTGRNIRKLEVIYLDGTEYEICGGRPDGQALFEFDRYSVTKWMDTVTKVMAEQETEVAKERKKLQETWSLPEYMERLPELKLPFDGVRRKCCRMTLKDLERMPKEWDFLKENHFLLHGYYEYQHLLLGQLCARHGERFVIGVPGEYDMREQYMAESFGFQDFSPIEQGKKRRGSFGYWYYYLTKASY